MPKILAIDDKIDNLISLSALLRSLMPDCSVITAQSGAEGLEKAKDELPDVILLDIIMPGMDGFETCSRMKGDEATKHIPVIMITAMRTDAQSRVRALELGADAFLSKPIDETELVSQVKVTLRIKKAEDALRKERDSLEEAVRERTILLQQSEEKLSSIFRASPDWLTISTLEEGRYLKVNDAFLKTTGYERSEVIGRTSSELGLWGVPGYRREIIGIMQQQGFLKNHEVTIHTRSGEVLTMLWSAEAIDLEGTQCLINVLKDITDRKQVEEQRRELEERLKRSEKMESLGLLAGGVAHDLNNLLGVIVGHSEMLLDDIGESHPLRRDVVSIMNAGERAAYVVQDLLTMARRGVYVGKVINLNSVIADYEKTPDYKKWRSLHPHVEARTALDADLLNIKGSPVHLSKTIMNLVANAFEAMPAGGLLTIKTGNKYLDRRMSGYDEVKDGDYAVVSVSDTGEGISSDDMKRIFEPFYTKKVMGRSGTGLGLAVVWGTVKDHEGYIDIQSEKGTGTTFTLYFPVTRDDLTADQASVAITEYMGNGESILVVDDVLEQRELAARMLTKLNYRVTTVGAGLEAVDHLRNNRADLVVLDMIMDPGIDGLDTYIKIQEIYPRQKAIIVSGFSETERVRKAQELGAGSYVRKPYMLERLGLAVKKELQHPE